MSDPGIIHAAVEALAHTLSHVPAWQQFVGKPNALLARLKIYTDGLPPPDNPGETHSRAWWEKLRPFGLLWSGEESFNLYETAFRTYSAADELTLQIVKDVPGQLAGRIDEADALFRREVGQIVAGLAELSGVDAYFHFARLTASGPHWSPEHVETEQGVYQAYLLTFRYDEGGASG